MFRLQRYGVTWKPEVITRQLRGLIGPADHGILCVATDGVWVRRRDIAEISPRYSADRGHRRRVGTPPRYRREIAEI